MPVVDFETHDTTQVFYTEEPITIGKPETRFMPYSFLLKVGLASLESPPHRYRFVKDIHTFFDENRQIDAAPSTFDPKGTIVQLSPEAYTQPQARDSEHRIGSRLSD